MKNKSKSIIPIEAAGLLDKQRLFCEFYIEHLNGTKAATLAGYSKKTGCSHASFLLKQPKIKAYIQHLREAMRDEFRLSRAQLVEQVRETIKQAELKQDYTNKLRALDMLVKMGGYYEEDLTETDEKIIVRFGIDGGEVEISKGNTEQL